MTLAFFVFIVKVMFIVKNLKGTKSIKTISIIFIFYEGYLVNCEYINFVGNIYQMAKMQLER